MRHGTTKLQYYFVQRLSRMTEKREDVIVAQTVQKECFFDPNFDEISKIHGMIQ